MDANWPKNKLAIPIISKAIKFFTIQYFTLSLLNPHIIIMHNL